MGEDASIPLGYFPHTRWSLVFRAGGSEDARQEALSEFLRQYVPALKGHLVARKGHDRDRANDLVQGFVTDKIVERKLLGRVTGGKGKFRTFLLTAFDRYVEDQRRRESARKRSPGRLSRLSDEDAALASPSSRQPDALFDVAWARALLSEVLQRMQGECDASGRAHLWEVFRCRLLDPILNNVKPPAYERLVERFGFTSPAQACNALVTCKRMFVRILRSAVAEYEGAEGVDAEISDLRETLSRSGA